MNPVQGPFPTTPWEEPNVHLCTRTRRDVVRGIHIYIYTYIQGGLRRGGLTPARGSAQWLKRVPVCNSRLLVRQYCQGVLYYSKTTFLSEVKANGGNAGKTTIAIRTTTHNNSFVQQQAALKRKKLSRTRRSVSVLYTSCAETHKTVS